MKVQNVAIIGAGASGLTALKTCLEAELQVVCYEQSDDVSGLWKYRPVPEEGMSGCMQGTYMNCSKEMSAFSDFPPPEEFPNFMPHAYVYKYLSSYADHFDLRRHILFRQRVTSLKPTDDYETTGKWTVELLDLVSQKKETKIHDAVMVCAGHHVYPYYPVIPGVENFKGTTMHSHDFKTPDGFQDKKVAVVGLGNSGTVVAVEASRVAQQVYLCSRKGGWIHARLGERGEPFDAEYHRRSVVFKERFKSLGTIFTQDEEKLNLRFDHDLYGLKPQHRIYNQYIIVNDELPLRILNGSVLSRIRIETLTSSGIKFEGDPEIYPIDVLVYATGYRHFYPFLCKSLVDLDNCPLELYKFVFPVRLRHHTLAFVGEIDPDGSIFNVSEMQSRWITQIWTGKVSLPLENKMKITCQRNLKLLQTWGNEGSRHQTRIFWFFYMERLAEYIGVKPNLMKLFLSDPKLFWACFTGPVLPYQYRIQGPHSWIGCRQAILTYEDRMRRPLKGKQLSLFSQSSRTSNNDLKWFFKMAAFGLAIVCVGLVVQAKILFYF